MADENDDPFLYVREQGRMAHDHNKSVLDEERSTPDNPVAKASEAFITEFDCPYGEGGNRDAWLEGFKGDAEPEAAEVVTSESPDGLTTKVEPTDPDANGPGVPQPETTIGDPHASTIPAAISHRDEATGNLTGESGPAPTDTPAAVAASDVM